MEPTEDLKSNPPDGAALEAWLRANSNLQPLPDNGFSNRVLASLPRAAQHRLQRSSGCIAAVILGGALALAGVFNASPAVTDDLFVSLNNPLTTPPALIALVATAGSLWFAFRHRLRSVLR